MTGTIFISFHIGITSLYQSLWDSASTVCFTPAWGNSVLCSKMGVVYPDYPRLLELYKTSARNSTTQRRTCGSKRGGGSPQANSRRDHTSRLQIRHEFRFQEGPGRGTRCFRTFHFRRNHRCGYRGGSRSANGRSNAEISEAAHVSALAYTGVNATPDKRPIISPTGIVDADKLMWPTWKMGLGLVSAAGGLATRLAAELHEMSLREVLSHLVRRLFKLIMGNVVSVCMRL